MENVWVLAARQNSIDTSFSPNQAICGEGWKGFDRDVHWNRQDGFAKRLVDGKPSTRNPAQVNLDFDVLARMFAADLRTTNTEAVSF